MSINTKVCRILFILGLVTNLNMAFARNPSQLVGEGRMTTDLSLDQHPYFKDYYTPLRDQFSQILSALPLVELTLGKSPNEIIEHYDTLVQFLASNSLVSRRGLGDGVTGYTLIRSFFTRDVLENLEIEYPEAIEKFCGLEDQNFEVWSSHFSSKSLAMKALFLQTEWTLVSIEGRAFLQDIAKLMSVSHGAPEYQNLEQFIQDSNSATTYCLNESAFSLRLRGGQWGRGNSYGEVYKTISSLIIAYSLYNQGYSRADSYFGIRSMLVFYETIDLLFDHLGYKKEFYKKYQDRTFGSLQPSYERFIENFNQRFKNQSSFRNQVLSNFLLLPPLLRPLLNLMGNHFVEDDLIFSSLLLIGATHGDASFFDQEIKPMIISTGEDPQKAQLLVKLLEAAQRDIEWYMEGHQFVFDSLSGESPAKNQWQGLFE